MTKPVERIVFIITPLIECIGLISFPIKFLFRGSMGIIDKII